jgi:nitroreductase
MAEADEVFTKIPDLNYLEDRPLTNPLEFAAIVKARRSVRVYNETPVPESVMREVLSWTLLAPNSSNLQCWEFIWVRTPEIKKKLALYCFNQPAAKTAQELVVAVARPHLWKKHAQQMLEKFAQAESQGQHIPESAKAYYAKLAPFIYTQGPLNIVGYFKKMLFFVRGLFKITPREPTSYAQMRLWGAKSTALACENFMLGMSAHGFDTCPMEGFDSKRVKKLLELKASDEVVMVISCGQRAQNGVYGPRVRFDEAQFIKEV